MRKLSYTMGLALALSVGALATAGAQAQQPQGQQQGQGQFRRGQGRGDEMLLRGINLTSAQKEQIKALRKEDRKENEARREKREQNGQVARVPRDTANMGARRAEMGKRREQQIGQIRNILTPAQQAQFDKNLADMKARMAAGRRG